MNEAEAREAAWQSKWGNHAVATLASDPIPALSGAFKEVFDAGWEAARQYDEKRIAALVEAAATVERTFGDGGAYGGSKAYGWLAIQQLRLALEPFMEEAPND